jgi:5-methylcytosine-specific restriction endonuclease McrA
MYLHTHHINADITNDKHENLKVLCIECHAKEFKHGHIKQTSQ